MGLFNEAWRPEKIFRQRAIKVAFGHRPFLKFVKTFEFNPAIYRHICPAGFFNKFFIELGEIGDNFQIAGRFALMVLSQSFEISHHKPNARIRILFEQDLKVQGILKSP